MDVWENNVFVTDGEKMRLNDKSFTKHQSSVYTLKESFHVNEIVCVYVFAPDDVYQDVLYKLRAHTLKA